MTSTDPQFLYMVLVLPTFFGLTLVGEGLNKVLKDERMGWASIVFGVIFVAVVCFIFYFFSENLIGW